MIAGWSGYPDSLTALVLLFVALTALVPAGLLFRRRPLRAWLAAPRICGAVALLLAVFGLALASDWTFDRYNFGASEQTAGLGHACLLLFVGAAACAGGLLASWLLEWRADRRERDDE